MYFSDMNNDKSDPGTNNNNIYKDITINNDINKNVKKIKNERDVFTFKKFNTVRLKL